MALKRSISLFASSRLLPKSLSVIMEAEAWEMEQPLPPNLTSATLSPSKTAYTVTSSPQRGLRRCSSRSGFSNSPRFLGRR
jgi:hypothetical protein